MHFFRYLYGVMVTGAQYQARWELAMSTNILKSRKRLMVLGLLLVPVLVGCTWLFAAEGQLPTFLGGKTAFGPSHYTHLIFGASILVGLCAGLISGCIGAGGGFIIAPALMSAGVKGILAVGTDLFHIFAKGIMGSVLHSKMGHVSVKLAVTFLIGALAGSYAGGTLNRAIYAKNPVLSDTFITCVYVIILGFLAFFALSDWLKARNKTAVKEECAKHYAEEIPPMGRKLQSLNLPPMITFDENVTPGGRRISWIFLVFSGFIVGVAAGIMGVGGGFLTFPMFVYGLGVSSATTVGTDIFQIMFTAGYNSIFQYGRYGFVFYTLAMGMLLGSLIGIQIGSLVTKVVPGMTIRGFFALTVSAGFVNRLCALPAKLASMSILNMSSNVAELINLIGTVIFFAIIIAFAVWVFFCFFSNFKQLKGEEAR